MGEIYDLLKKAEMLVLASPVYYHNISGQLKCVIDRFYTDSCGNTVTNLGVHEHWNNSVDKQYSRNLGINKGIELIYLEK